MIRNMVQSSRFEGRCLGANLNLQAPMGEQVIQNKAKSEGKRTCSATRGAGLTAQGNQSSLRHVCRNANLSVKNRAGTSARKNAQMKVDPDELVRANGHYCDKIWLADEFMKTKGSARLPMSC